MGADFRDRGVVEDLFQVLAGLDGLVTSAGDGGRGSEPKFGAPDLLLLSFPPGERPSSCFGCSCCRRLLVTLRIDKKQTVLISIFIKTSSCKKTSTF